MGAAVGSLPSCSEETENQQLGKLLIPERSHRPANDSNHVLSPGQHGTYCVHFSKLLPLLQCCTANKNEQNCVVIVVSVTPQGDNSASLEVQSFDGEGHEESM